MRQGGKKKKGFISLEIFVPEKKAWAYPGGKKKKSAGGKKGKGKKVSNRLLGAGKRGGKKK